MSRSAEQAKAALHGKEIFGNVVNVEWSKNGKKSNKIQLPSNTSRSVGRSEMECYICRELGHIAKECKNKERNESGKKLGIEDQVTLENLRKERNRVRARVKSPERYGKVMMMNFNTEDLRIDCGRIYNRG